MPSVKRSQPHWRNWAARFNGGESLRLGAATSSIILDRLVDLSNQLHVLKFSPRIQFLSEKLVNRRTSLERSHPMLCAKVLVKFLAPGFGTPAESGPGNRNCSDLPPQKGSRDLGGVSAHCLELGVAFAAESDGRMIDS